MRRTILMLLVLSGCQSNDLSNEEHVRVWANAASALGVFSNGYDVVARADGQTPFPDPACPAIADDGTTITITGDCTNSEGTEYYGEASVVRSGGDRDIAFDGFGKLDNGTQVTMEGTLTITELADGSHDFVADFVHTGGAKTTYDYTGNVAGTYTGPTTWNGSGTVSRSSVVAPSGSVDATTVDQLRDDALCIGQNASGTTTLVAGAQTAVVTYDGATDCDDADDDAEWSLDGVDQGPITGITCAVSRGSRGGAALVLPLLAALVVLRVRRKR